MSVSGGQHDKRKNPKKPLKQASAKGNIVAIGGKVGEGAIVVGGNMSIGPVSPPNMLIPRQIPDPVPDFTGRKPDINGLLAAFRRAGGNRGAVISGVRGMGGVGKTELAKMAAKRLMRRFPDGQIFFNLRGAGAKGTSKPATPAEALQHVIVSFQAEARLPESVDAMQALYHSLLQGKRVLLFMDNALDADQLLSLSPPPEGCALIVTSRNHISLPGMNKLNIEVLPPDEARALLLSVCPRIKEHADLLAERCGYLPLALRLGASALERNPALKVEEWLDRLSRESQRLAELDKQRPMVGVDRGIQASLAASYNLLDKRRRQLWRALAVFPGDFDAPAAAAVWKADEEHPADTLADFYAASMVIWDGKTNRYRLHDLARVFAQQRMTDKEAEIHPQRHAEYYCSVLAAAKTLYLVGGESSIKGFQVFDLEWHNIQEGKEWAAAHVDDNQGGAELASRFPHAFEFISMRVFLSWLEQTRQAIDVARKLNNRSLEGPHSLTNIYEVLGDSRKAVEYHEIGDRRGEAITLHNLADELSQAGRRDDAVTASERALKIASRLEFYDIDKYRAQLKELRESR